MSVRGEPGVKECGARVGSLEPRLLPLLTEPVPVGGAGSWG